MVTPTSIRAERAAHRAAAVKAKPVWPVVFWAMFAAWGVLPSAGLFVGAVMTAGEHDSDAAALLQASLGWFVFASAVAVVARYVAGVRPRRFEAAARALADATGGRAARGLLPTLDWLDAHWPDHAPVETTTLRGGGLERRWNVAFVHRGHPVLLLVNDGSAQRADVFVAHAAAGSSPQLVGSSANKIRAAGFAPHANAAGIRLTRSGLDDLDETFAHAALDAVLDATLALATDAPARAAGYRAAPSSAIHGDYLVALARAVGFRQDDLAANRAGVMTGRQRRREMGLGLLLLVAALAAGAWASYMAFGHVRDRGGHPSSVVGRALGVGTFALGAAGLLYVALGALRAAAAGRADAVVGTVLTRTEYGGRGGKTYHYEVAGRSFGVRPRALAVVLPGVSHRVYFIPRTGRLLSLEPVNE
jgi:hypothetical protein